ncbi:MAG: hypothetical protein LBG84_09785 [Treponema sp.]|jgi:tetratricopeptide (TPR) repeat protein|nr:hypothetical protein [Treponema sp.]
MRLKLRGGILSLFLALFIPLLYAQTPNSDEVFVPFVSRLAVEIRNNFIRLSWKDAQRIHGPVFIYRSETPFSTASANALPVPVEVPYGAEAYLDEADKPGPLYYLVAASDQEGRKYNLPIPSMNIIGVVVGPENVPDYSGLDGESAGKYPLFPLGPSQISAKAEDDKVIVTFSTVESDKNLILYRSIRPIRRQEDLLSALIIQREVHSPFTDYPIPGIPYYYAVVYEEDLGNALVIQSGRNATADPVEALSGKSRTGLPREIRAMPLPRMNLSPMPPSPPVSMGPEASRAAASIAPRRNREVTPELEAQSFSEDLEEGAAGEDFQLHSIIRDAFSFREWKRAEEELRRFLEIKRSAQNQAKASFYLGQACYFQDKPREALFEFLKAREVYPEEVKPWIKAVLGRQGAGAGGGGPETSAGS